MAIQPVTNPALQATLAPSLPQARLPSSPGPDAVAGPGTEFQNDTSQAPKVAAEDGVATLGTLANRSELEDAVSKVQQAVGPVAQNLLFSIDDETGKTVIKVIDSSTQETIRQIPSEELLAIAKALDKLQGLLVKQEA